MGKENMNREMSRLLDYGVRRGIMEKEDITYAANRMMAKLNMGEFEYVPGEKEIKYPSEALEPMCDYAVRTGLIAEDTRDERDRFDTEIMDCMMPRPSQVISAFRSLYKKDPKKATDYYYDLSRASNYIRTDRVEKDLMWTAPTKYGDLVITVNLSKPEKDPKAIAAAKNAPPAVYPKCDLCRENEGNKGSGNQPARANHRLMPITLYGERWFLQYSPYVYYNEHCIILSEAHRPMRVSRRTFENLLDFITVLPHYFVGSNADLPIVGGSILSHDHFQGGNYEFPMAKAPVRESVSFEGFPDIEAGIVDWPMSVIRLRSKDREGLIELADKILGRWREYSDESADILACTENTPHNTVTPIARHRDEKYELDLVLRNNRTTEEYPLGIFHPHNEYHHIKKENIGLIEVMGLAILPPRLLKEMEAITKALSEPDTAGEIMSRPEMEQHIPWYERLKAENIPPENVRKAVESSVGEIFGKLLADAGVYKDTPEGRAAMKRFCESV